MDPVITNAIAAVDRRHWLYRARRFRITQTLTALGVVPNSSMQVLDIGCGSGGTTVDLSKWGEVTALDASPTACAWVRQRLPRATVIQGTIDQLDQFYDAPTFDLVCCFHVLYHREVASVRGALASIAGQLKPGGLVLLEEPADHRLRRQMDLIDDGVRRFELAELYDGLVLAGLEPLTASLLNAWAWPVARGLAIRDRMVPGNRKRLPRELTVGPESAVLTSIAMAESALMLAGARWGRGTACWLVAHKPAG